MKEFDLQAAKNGKKVQTREGNEARIICFDRKDAVRPIVALVQVPDIDAPFDQPRYVEEVRYYAPNGKTDPKEPQLDLVMATEKKVGWVNIYKEPLDNHSVIGVYTSEKEALEDANKDDEKAVATIKVEWEE